MSRSQWASAEACAPLTAAVCGTGIRARLVYRARFEHRRLAVSARSTSCIFWVVAASIPVLVAPAAVADAAVRPGVHGSSHGARRPADRARPTARAGRGSRAGHGGLAHGAGSSAGRRRPTTAVLALGSGYSSRHGSALVRALQRRLAGLGDPPGPIDGRYGPLSEQAVIRFQATHGLQVDGIAGPRTFAALAAPGAALYPGAGYATGGSAVVRALQLRLVHAHLATGPIDGLYGPLTERAVSQFQAAHGLRVDGLVDPQTFAALRKPEPSPGPSHPRSHPRPAHPRSHPRPAHPRPQRNHRPAGRPVRSNEHPGGGLSADWIVALCLAVGLLLIRIASYTRRRRGSRPVPSARTRSRGREPAAVTHEATIDVPLEAERDVADAELAARRADALGEASGSFDLGVLLQERGNTASAQAAYERAADRGHAAAASNLGVLLDAQGDLAGAEAAYRRADERGDANGAFNLGVLLEEQGNLIGAEDAYRRADGRGHAPAASNLGVLLERQHDPASAEAAYRRADQQGDANGAFNLGMLLEEQGNPAGAEAAYRRADQRGEAEVAQRARAALLNLRRRAETSNLGHGGGV